MAPPSHHLQCPQRPQRPQRPPAAVAGQCARRAAAVLVAAGWLAGAGAQSLPAPAGLSRAAVDAAMALARQAAVAAAPPGARIEAEALPLDTRLALAPCNRVEPALTPGQRPLGRTRVSLRCTDGPARWTVSLPLLVRAWAPALASRAPLPAGTALAAAQFERAEVDWAAQTTPPFTDAGALEGRRLALALAAGQAVRSADLLPRLWFTAGQTVEVVASGPGFSAVGAGTALANGLDGVATRVRTESGRVLSGRPVGDRRIEVGP